MLIVFQWIKLQTCQRYKPHHSEKIFAEFTSPCGAAAKTNSAKLEIFSRISFLKLNINVNLPQPCKLKMLTSTITANFYGEGSSVCVQVLNSEFACYSCLSEKNSTAFYTRYIVRATFDG